MLNTLPGVSEYNLGVKQFYFLNKNFRRKFFLKIFFPGFLLLETLVSKKRSQTVLFVYFKEVLRAFFCVETLGQRILTKGFKFYYDKPCQDPEDSLPAASKTPLY